MEKTDALASVRSPSVVARLLCWLGIYFTAQLPFILFIAFFWAYPIGLAVFFLSGFPTIESHPDAKVTAYTLAYGFYLGHLALSLTTRSKQTFIVLMIILIVAVCLNFSGCNSDMAGLGQIKG